MSVNIAEQSNTKQSNTKTKAELYREKVLSLLQSADRQNQSADLAHPDPSTLSTESQIELENASSFSHLYEESLQHSDFKMGDVVKGTVVAVHRDHVLVDINYKSEGLIPKSEFRMPEGQTEIKQGQEIDVYIERVENEDGMIVLSKDRADIIRVWKDIAKVAENEEVIEGTVVAKVKGGLSVDIGVKAFLPGSQIDLRPAWDLSVYVGKKYRFRIIKFNQKRGNIVLSRRVLLTQERRDLRARTLSEIKEGAIIKGTVKNITDYGVFLDLGGLDGLLHITDMSWNRIRHPSELMSLGQEVEVKVLKFDQDKNRVSLGLKQLTEDPWSVVNQEIKVGDVLKAQVVSLTDYGAFMKLREGVEGLIHISEMSWGKKVKHPSQVLKVNGETAVKVLGMDQKNHRISLGLKQLQENPWVVLKEKYSIGQKMEVKVKSITDFGVFVELEGEELDGFIHVSDLSWTEHIFPRSRYKKGEVLTAIVRDINIRDERFNLSIKHLSADPWKNVESKYSPGSRHEVKVKKIMDFGVFVELEPGVEGLIHVSELSTQRLEKPDQVVKVGEKVLAEMLNIDTEARKIGLSVKQVQLRETAVPSSGKAPSDGGPSAEQAESSGRVSPASRVPPSATAKETEKPKAKKKSESFFGRALKASLGKGTSKNTEKKSDNRAKAEAENKEVSDTKIESKAVSDKKVTDKKEVSDKKDSETQKSNKLEQGEL